MIVKNKKFTILVVIALLALSMGAYWYKFSRGPKDLRDSISVGQNTKGEPSEGSGYEDDMQLTNSSNSKKDSPSNNGAPKTITKPSGNFVSSHEVNINDVVASSCVTTSGAKCTMIFTKDGTKKSLNEQTTDREGATFWEWTPKQIGLSSGEWTIEAKATNGTETKIAKDAINLRVN